MAALRGLKKVQSLIKILIVVQLMTPRAAFSAKKESLAELEDYINQRRWTRENATAPPFRGISSSPEIINQYFQDVIPAYFKQSQTCSDNNLLVNMLVNSVRQGGSEKDLEDLITNVCTIGRYNQVVCSGLAKRLGPTFHFVVKNRPDLSSEILVGHVFQSDGCTAPSPYNEWTLESKDDGHGNATDEATAATDYTAAATHDTTAATDYTAVAPHDTTAATDGTTAAPPTTMAAVSNKDGSIQITMNVHLQISTPKQRRPKVQMLRVQASSRAAVRKPMKIVHLTDIHVDPRYEVNSNGACDNKILCCHKTDGPPPNASVSAGLWGYGQRCDTPIITLESALSHIKVKHADADLFYMSGDLIPHNMWYTSREDNIKYIREISDTIRMFLPNAKIVPTFGNHEPHPVNMISPDDSPASLNTAWINNATYHSWLGWIPESSAEEFIQTGHYSIRISDKFRVLVLNSNVCYGFNFWNLYRVNESKNQLLWLRDELDKSSQADEMVHILGHVPPGYLGCSKVFSRNYYYLIGNYSKIIRGQFFGHLHSDTFRLYYSQTNKTVPVNVQWISPSLTPYKSNNPAYKVYYADPVTMEIVDHETYILNLDKVNSEVILVPEWDKFYTATQAYGIEDVKMDSLDKFVGAMAKNEKLFQLYFRHMHKAINETQVEACATYCKKRFLCRIVRPYFQAEEECELVQLKIDGGIVPIYDQLCAV